MPIEWKFVIPANAGIQKFNALDTGFRRCDGLKGFKRGRYPFLAFLIAVPLRASLRTMRQ